MSKWVSPTNGKRKFDVHKDNPHAETLNHSL